jgi:hypothetical protein
VARPEDHWGSVRDAFALSLFHVNATLQHGAAALLRGDRSAVSALCDLLHRVVGTAASLGFDAIATHCRALESALQRPEARWHAKLYAAMCALDEPCAGLLPVARSSMRTGSARSLTLLTSDPTEPVLEFDAHWPIDIVTRATDCPHPPRGVLLVDARRDAIACVRLARGVWASNPVVAIIPGATEAESLLALRAGADLIHRGELTAEALRLSAWSALPPPFAHGTVLSLDTDSLRASALRAALDALGANVVSIETEAQLQQRLGTQWPPVAVIDASHAEATCIATAIDRHGASVSIITLGDEAVTWSGQRLAASAPFSALVVACASALCAKLGPDDGPVQKHGASTQAIERSRADVQTMCNDRKESSNP